MCYSCEPAIGQLADWLTQDMNLNDLPTTSTVTTETTESKSIRIFSNGTIITMASGTFSQVEALVVKGDEIVYTGNLQGAHEAAESGAETIDLQKKCLLPGFIEPHLHLMLTALADNYLIKLSPLEVPTFEDVINKISDAATHTHLEDRWVAGYGYDPSRIEGHPELTIKNLDPISMVVPIFVLNESGHIAYANSKALQEAGVTPENVKNDSNYQKDDRGNLTGVLFELAAQQVGSKIRSIRLLHLSEWCKNTLTNLMTKGCTTIFDAGIGAVGKTDGMMMLLGALPCKQMRFYGALSNNAMPSWYGKPPYHLGDIEIIAMKYWADGSTQGFTAALKEPYLNPPDPKQPCGAPFFPDAGALQAVMDKPLKDGFQLVVHSNGDAATELVLDAYEAVFKANPDRKTNIMHRIEHFTVTEEQQRVRAKNLGLGVSHSIGHVNYWGETFCSYVLGSKRAECIDPLRSDEKAGLVWSLHSDSPLTDVNPLLYLKTATTRLMSNGGGVLGKDECVDLETALRGITINPAKQIGIADKVGTLEVGKNADMVVLNYDPRTVDHADLDKLIVEQTWMGGRQSYSKS